MYANQYLKKSHKLFCPICLNNIIYYLPNHLKEYIMLHELTHTKIKNHSSIFWEELEKICPNSKLKKQELRNKYAIR